MICAQAASGAGQAAMDELELQTREALDGKPITQNIFPFQVRRHRCLITDVAWFSTAAMHSCIAQPCCDSHNA